MTADDAPQTYMDVIDVDTARLDSRKQPREVDFVGLTEEYDCSSGGRRSVRLAASTAASV